MKKNIFLSVIIPAYNEETNIRLGTLDKVSRYLDAQTYTWEVIIVNDGSIDATSNLLNEFVKTNRKFVVIHNPHQGKAATVITGVMAAQGEIILFSDLDQATPLNQVEKIFPWFSNGYDVVIGSRQSRREGAPFLRLLMARGFMFLRTVILGLDIIDTQCGFKAFSGSSARKIFEKLELYRQKRVVSGSMVTAGFDIEVLFLAKKLGYKIREVSVEWHYVETRRVNPIRDSWQGLLDILKIRINALQGKYHR